MPIKELGKSKENKEIRIGDRVVILDSGETFSTYSKWVVGHIKNPEQIARYRYGVSPHNGQVGTVVCIAPHEFGHTDCAYIRTTEGFYLISVRGLGRIYGTELFEDEELFGEQ